VSFALTFYIVSRGTAKFVGTDTVLQVAGYSSQQAPSAAFGLSSLKGNFAFLLAGSSSAGPIATAGSFAADGSGNILSGELDENRNGTPTPAVAFVSNGSNAGKYTVAPDGSGTLTFATAARTYTLLFYLGPGGAASTAVLQETDSGITSDGNFTTQQTAAFTAASLSGNYALEISGISAATLQVISGQIAADGAGTIPSGKIDINTAGAVLSAQAVTGTYSAPAATGRTTLALNAGSLNYAAYIVSPTQVYLIGIQSGQLAAGALLRQF
jgi:hypothetical protein